MAAPSMRDELPSSPVQQGLYGTSNKTTSTLKSILTNKHVLNSMKWGFCTATLVTFHGLYHSRGNIMLSLTFGTMAFCVVSPAKFWMYQRRQRHEFFRSLAMTSKQNTNILGTGKASQKVHSRQALYDPNEPYTDEEWAFAQKIYRRTIYYSIGGGSIGLVTAVAILTAMNVTRVTPLWIRFGFTSAFTLFGAGLAFRMNLNDAIKEAQKWQKEGRLKQEVKYVINWMNADQAEKESRPDPSKPGQNRAMKLNSQS